MPKKISPKVEEYLISLLNGNEEIASKNANRIISSKLATQEDIDAMQNWAKRVKDLLQRARSHRKRINSSTFSSLKNEAILLDSEYPKNYMVQYRLMDVLGKQWTPADAPEKPVNNTESQASPSPKKETPPPLFNPDGTHHNYLGAQKPSSSWTILVDESGGFKPEEFNKDKDAIPVGVCVAVLVPEEAKLPDMNTHATEIGPIETQKIIKILLESNCAVIGTSCSFILSAKNSDDLWLQCNKNLIDLILMFLPIDKKTTLRFFIEQRDVINFKARSLFEALCQDSLSRLRLIDNKRFSLIDTEFHVITKYEHKWNGYPDAASHIWAYDNGKESLEMSQWVNTCLFESDSEQNQELFNVLQKGAFSYEDWSKIVSMPQKERSLLSRVLELIGNCFKSDPKRWYDMLREVDSQNLFSGIVDLQLLQRQVDFLSKYKPDRSQINDEQQLDWLQTQIALYNYLGHTDFIQSCHLELTELCSRLYEENAPLVCNTMLNISTGFTNSFQFAFAKKIIGQWLDEQPGLPGSQYYSQVLSLMGQLETFLGNHKKAIEYFNQALEKFTTLSDESRRATNIRKTLSYKVIAMMDSDPVPDNMLEELTKYLESPLEQAARFLSEPHKNQDPFQHHVLLRYLTVCRDEKAINAYLTNEPRWTVGSFHPWELIYFYRALLVNSPKKRNELLRLAVNTALSAGDGTLNVIACVILGGLYYYDPSCKDELVSLTQKVIESMPFMDKQRVQALKNQIESPKDPLTLAKEVLPFNFR